MCIGVFAFEFWSVCAFVHSGMDEFVYCCFGIAVHVCAFGVVCWRIGVSAFVCWGIDALMHCVLADLGVLVC